METGVFTPDSSMKTSPFDHFFQRVKKHTPIQNQSQLAQALGIGRAAVSSAKHKNRVPPGWVLTLSDKYAIPPEFLSPGAEPLLPSNATSNGPQGTSAATVLGDILRTVVHRLEPGHVTSWLSAVGDPESLVLLEVTEDNMSPEIRPGGAVVIDGSQRDLLNGHVYALEVEGRVTLRRIDKVAGSLSLLSSNRDYPPVCLKDGHAAVISVLGRVLLSLHTYPRGSLSPQPSGSAATTSEPQAAHGPQQLPLFPPGR